MKTLILGGVRSGKSRLAEAIAKTSGKKVLYIATATAGDDEMKARIQKHKENRPDNWVIIEEQIKLAKTIQEYSNQNYCILVDCLTLWLTNILLNENGLLLDQERHLLLNTLIETNEEIIFVANETNMGIIPLGDLSRRFGDEAGITNQLLAAECDRVILTVAGLPLTLKGTKYEDGMA